MWSTRLNDREHVGVEVIGERRRASMVRRRMCVIRSRTVARPLGILKREKADEHGPEAFPEISEEGAILPLRDTMTHG